MIRSIYSKQMSCINTIRDIVDAHRFEYVRDMQLWHVYSTRKNSCLQLTVTSDATISLMLIFHWLWLAIMSNTCFNKLLDIMSSMIMSTASCSLSCSSRLKHNRVRIKLVNIVCVCSKQLVMTHLRMNIHQVYLWTSCFCLVIEKKEEEKDKWRPSLIDCSTRV
jgi:hypothetical protein